MEPIRTDFRGYEGKFVATHLRSGDIVMADEDYHALCDRLIATGLNLQAEVSYVPMADEPRYRIGC